MSRYTKQISVTFSRAAIKYIDWMCNQQAVPTSRSTLINALIEGRIDLDSYAPPPDIKAELEQAKSQRLYQRD